MRVEVETKRQMRYADGSPVRAASAVAQFTDGTRHGFLVIGDDTTHGAWFVGDGVCDSGTAVRLMPTTGGLETFEEAAGTKHLKPDLEAACAVQVGGEPAVLALGSGSSPARRRWSLLRLDEVGQPFAVTAAMDPLYAAIGRALGVSETQLNLEGAHRIDDRLRLYQRGLPAVGVPSASVDLALAEALDAALGRRCPEEVSILDATSYDLGARWGASSGALAITDAVHLAGMGLVLASLAAEDTANPRDDGAVLASSLALLDGPRVVAGAALPLVDGAVVKVEGLMLLAETAGSARVLAVVDGDDPEVASLAMWLRIDW